MSCQYHMKKKVRFSDDLDYEKQPDNQEHNNKPYKEDDLIEKKTNMEEKNSSTTNFFYSKYFQISVSVVLLFLIVYLFCYTPTKTVSVGGFMDNVQVSPVVIPEILRL